MQQPARKFSLVHAAIAGLAALWAGRKERTEKASKMARSRAPNPTFENERLTRSGMYGEPGAKRLRQVMRGTLGTKHGRPATILRTNGRCF